MMASRSKKLLLMDRTSLAFAFWLAYASLHACTRTLERERVGTSSSHQKLLVALCRFLQQPATFRPEDQGSFGSFNLLWCNGRLLLMPPPRRAGSSSSCCCCSAPPPPRRASPHIARYRIAIASRLPPCLLICHRQLELTDTHD